MSLPKVTIIDYGMGNIFSVTSALKYLGTKVELTSNPNSIVNSSILILPGVGAFDSAMSYLRNNGIEEAIIEAVKYKKVKILGICLGMQLLGSQSNENGQTKGIGLIENEIKRFTSEEVNEKKIPHVGFNSIEINEKTGLFSNLPDSPDFYFTHSYRMMNEDLNGNFATCNYGVDFLAAYEIGNICGTQFHPEKSQTNGLILLKNFIQL